MGLKGYLRFGVYTETVGEKETPGQSEQFLIREFSLSDEELSEEDDEHIYVPYVTAQEFWESLPSFVQMAVYLPNPGIKPGLPHCKQILYHLSPQESP